MVKLVDTPGLGPGALCHAGSSPAARKRRLFFVCFLIKKEGHAATLVFLLCKQSVLSLAWPPSCQEWFPLSKMFFAFFHKCFLLVLVCFFLILSCF